MEEQVGAYWHRLITRSANRRYPEAVVALDDIKKVVGVMFRALGGDSGLKVEESYATNHFGRRTFLQKIAGSDQRIHNSWLDESALLLPPTIDLLPERELNRDLYIWLAMLASLKLKSREVLHWIEQNRRQSSATLLRFPGFADRYSALASAVVELRVELKTLAPDLRKIEQQVREIIINPTNPATDLFKVGDYSPEQSVPLWLVPHPAQLAGDKLNDLDDKQEHKSKQDDPENGENERSKESKKERKNRLRKAERTDDPDGKSGLIAFRMESLFTLAEFVKVDRTTDDESDDDAESKAEDLDVITISKEQQSGKGGLKFDLDLPAAEYDDTPLSAPILYPEWNYKTGVLEKNMCSIVPLISNKVESVKLPVELQSSAQKVRRQFEALIPQRTWFRGEVDGSELDIDSYIQFRSAKSLSHNTQEPALYKNFRSGSRDLATLLLADLSLSTDSWVNNHSRVIDVIRESLHLFADALSHTGDRFSLYGFSSRSREHVRFHQLKTFSEPFNDQVRGRIEDIKPGYYTRMGAAIRHAASILSKQPAARRILLILTDGKPNDLDHYEGRYGIEDTREAIFEAKRQGLYPFCVTIDEEGKEYLPHIFGPSGFIVIRKPAELPMRLPKLYAKITQGEA